MSSLSENRLLEHQFSIRARIEIVEKFLRRGSARHLVPAGDQGPRLRLPGRACSAGSATTTSSSAASRCTMASPSLSRVPMREEDRLDWQANGEARHVGVRLDCGIRLENVYVPAGGDIPDRDAEPQVRPEARLHRADDALVRGAATARRSWSATSTSRRSNATSGATSSCSTSSATRRSRSRR